MLKKHHGMNKLAAFCFCTLLLFGCGKESKKDVFLPHRLETDIQTICRQEYNLDVAVKLHEDTLYIYLDVGLGSNEDGIDFSKISKDKLLALLFGLNLSENDQQNIANAMLAASRAAVSTSAEIKFYKIIGSNKQLPFIEYIFTRYVMDIKKFMLGAISRNDYIKRMDIDVEFNPVVIGQDFVKSFFKDLENGKDSEIIKTYFPESLSVSQISPTFFAMLMEHNMKLHKKYDIQSMKALRLNKNSALIYADVHETYAKDAESNHTYLTPEDFVNSYLFVVNTQQFPKIIEKIYTLKSFDEAGNVINKPFPKEYAAYSDIDTWTTDQKGFFNETFPSFLSKRIASQIRSRFMENEKLSKLYTTNSVYGNYKIDKVANTKSLIFLVDIDRRNSAEGLELMDDYYVNILDKTLTIISDLVASYEFEDFDQMQLIYKPTQKQIILDAKQLQQFYKNKLSINDLLKQSDMVKVSLT